MNVIAFDCSFEYVQIVLYKGDNSEGESGDKSKSPLFFSGSGHRLFKEMMGDQRLVGVAERGNYCSTEKTLELFSKLLDQEKLQPKDLDALVVISGPGSFTSLRVSAMVVKILAYTQNIPLYAFSHFDLERYFLSNFFHEDNVAKYFLIAHAIHKREFAYVLLEKNQLNQLYGNRPQPKLEKVNNLDRWFKNCLAQCSEQADKQVTIFSGESANWLFELLRDLFKQSDDFEKQGYFFSENKNDLCIKKDGVSKMRLLEQKSEFFQDDFDKKKLGLGLLINFVLQGSSKNIDLNLYEVNAKYFCPDYMGGSWS